MKTRSGRVVAAAAEVPHEDVDMAIDVKPRARARTSTRSAKLDKPAPTPTFRDEEEDQQAADVFKVMSPVKIISPRAFPRTPVVTASIPNEVETLPEPKTFNSSPPGTTKTTMTRARSTKDLVESISHIPLPTESLDDAEVQQQHSARQHNPSTGAPHQPSQRRRNPVLWVALATIITCALAAFTFTSVCHSWPAPVQLPPNLATAAQPVCRDVHAAWLKAEQQGQAMLNQAQAQATVLKAQAQQQAQQLQAQAHIYLALAAAKLDQLKQQLAFLLPVPPHPARSFADVLPAEALRALVVQSADSIDVADVYQQALTHQTSHHKAPGILIACGAACDDLQSAVLAAAQPAQHVLVIDGAAPPASAGALQHQLATFLHTTPAGVVLVRHLTQLDVPCLSVLNNALSELGSLQLNGRTVGSSGALFLALLPITVPAVDDQTEGVIKAQLHMDVAAAAGATEAGQATTVARALRRRFEHALATGAAVVPPEAPAQPESDSYTTAYADSDSN